MCLRVLALVAAASVVTSVPVVAAAAPTAGKPTPILSKRIIGHSVLGRPIVAYHLGDARAKRTALILGQMHGDEPAGVRVARSLIHGTRSVEGIDLWVIPTMNPDGFARGTRQNAHGVDLNRNWPDNWVHLSGQYYSGPKPLSEPETRAMWRFLRTKRPRYVVSMHQPLDGVDKTAGSGPAYRRFRRALSRNLNLPVKDFQCWSVCHGSMSGWYQRKHIGVAVETVEFGSHPSSGYLVGQARRGIVAALGGHFGRLARHNPRAKVTFAPMTGRITVSGWAYDIDKPGTRLLVRLDEGDRLLARHWAKRPSPALDARTGIAGKHAYSFGVTAAPGRHRYCLTVRNLGAGASTQTCKAVTVPS